MLPSWMNELEQVYIGFGYRAITMYIDDLYTDVITIVTVILYI